MKEGRGQHPLFVMHGMPGGAGYFHAAAKQLDAPSAVFGIRWNAACVDSNVPTMQAHAAECLALLRTEQPRGPYFLAGHSYAAHLALEIGQQLFEAGEHVAFLAILDDEADLDRRQFGVRQSTCIDASVAEHCKRMQRTYVPRTYPGDVWLYQAAVRPPVHLADPTQGWRDLASGSIHRVDVPGDHSTFLTNEDLVASWAPHFDAHFARAAESARAEMSDPVALERRLERARNVASRPAVVAALAAREAAKRGDRDEEIAEYRRAVEAGAADVPWWVHRNLAEACAEAGDADAAMAAFMDAASREELPLCGLERAARHLRFMHRTGEARAVLEWARSYPVPDEPHAHIAASDLLAQQGDLAAAEFHLRRSWELVPAPRAWRRLAILLARKGQVARALRHDARVRDRWPTNDDFIGFVDEMARLANPELHLLVDGKRIDAVESSERMWRFTLCEPPRNVAIVSRSCVPSKTHLGHADRRTLGVPVTKIVVTAEQWKVEIGHKHPMLVDGFHLPEDDERWTTGSALIPRALLASCPRSANVEIHVSGRRLQYERYPAREA
jgi:thioesterase domain-containing protein